MIFRAHAANSGVVTRLSQCLGVRHDMTRHIHLDIDAAQHRMKIRSTQGKVYIGLPRVKIKAIKIGLVLIIIHFVAIKSHNKKFLITTFFGCHFFQSSLIFVIKASIANIFGHHCFFITINFSFVKVSVTLKIFLLPKVSITTFFNCHIFFCGQSFDHHLFQLPQICLSPKF